MYPGGSGGLIVRGHVSCESKSPFVINYFKLQLIGIGITDRVNKIIIVNWSNNLHTKCCTHTIRDSKI